MCNGKRRLHTAIQQQQYRFRAYFGLQYVHHHHYNQQCELHTKYSKPSPQFTAELENAVVVAPVYYSFVWMNLRECTCMCGIYSYHMVFLILLNKSSSSSESLIYI